MFDVNEKVVCINDTFAAWVYDSYNQLPVKGTVYTIREVDLGRSDLDSNSDVTFRVLLHELHNDPDFTASGRDIGELGFRSDRFATLQQLEELNQNELVVTNDGTTIIK